MPLIPSLRALLIDELRDLLFAERKLVAALPKMAKASTDPKLKAAFVGHLQETRGHVVRLNKAFKLLGTPARAKTCHAMVGLVREGAEAIEAKGPAEIRDANLIGAAQRVEHYEMAGYGTARSFAEALDEFEVVALLQATLDEEGDANQKLTFLSQSVNSAALIAAKGHVFVTAA
jgi:ferritin-like metal-binding protein YciE